MRVKTSVIAAGRGGATNASVRAQARDRLRATANALLCHRGLPFFVAMLAAALAAPALEGGWVLDDFYHRIVLLGTPEFRDLFGPPHEMFRFFRGDAERTTRVMDLGFFPWWTYVYGGLCDQRLGPNRGLLLGSYRTTRLPAR